MSASGSPKVGGGGPQIGTNFSAFFSDSSPQASLEMCSSSSRREIYFLNKSP